MLPFTPPARVGRVIAGAGVEPAVGAAYETAEPPLLYPRTRLAAAAGLEPAPTRLQDERSRSS